MKKGCWILMAALVLGSSMGAEGQDDRPLPVGPEIPVEPPGDGPSVALGPDGGLVAAWQTPAFSVAVRAFTPAGHPLLPEASEVSTSGVPAYQPQVATLGTGRSVVVWIEATPPLSLPAVFTRLLDASGQPIGEASLIGNGSDPAVAGLPSGEHVVVWRSLFGGEILARRFNATTPVTGEISVAPAGAGGAAVAARPDNGFVAAWHFGGAIFFRVYGPGGAPLTGPIQASVPGEGSHMHPRISTDAAGRIVVAWHLTRLPADDRILVRRFSPLGEPLGAAFRIHEARSIGPVDVAARPDGSFLTLFTKTVEEDEVVALARVFDAQGAPVGDPFRVHDTPVGLAGRVAADEDGWVVSWYAGEGSFLRRLATTCGPVTSGLCLNGGRFQIEVAWHVPATGARGTGHPMFLSEDTGAFWFFDRSNPELLVKVLDGRSLNGHFWVFFGALTNVEYDLTVIDTETGARQTWHNPAGTMASRADIRAFPAAGSTPAPAAARSAIALDGAAPLSLSGGADVSVEWRDPATGELKSAGGAPLSRDSAYFWFFGDDNAELLVKVLDGRAVNGHVWVFYGALTDLEYTLTVTLDGETRTYHNPRGRMASAADTQAF